ncbi:MAG: VOC family protein [Kiritimatiellae bacterium]|nr:VOC family protein [Kiritimatiellia bacterium]
MKPEIVNIILYCDQWQDTIYFYRDTIGFPVNMANSWLVEFKVTEYTCLSVANASATSIRSAGGAGITVTFKVPDLQGVWSALADKGVAVGPIRPSSLGGQAFFLHDPEKNRLEFWSA